MWTILNNEEDLKKVKEKLEKYGINSGNIKLHTPVSLLMVGKVINEEVGRFFPPEEFIRWIPSKLYPFIPEEDNLENITLVTVKEREKGRYEE